jgi:hypothetical protein
LKVKFPDVQVNWEKIVSPESPKPKIDVTVLSDDEIVSRLQEIRHDLGLNRRAMAAQLLDAGLTCVLIYNHREPLTYKIYSLIELKFQLKDDTLQNYTASIPQIATAVRQICSVQDKEGDRGRS